ncbi:hypothetical protein UlMin_017287 [Ulmus minor]
MATNFNGASTRLLLSQPIFNVLDYGAVGNANADDSAAFEKAWEAACGVSSNTETPILLIPMGKIFLLKPVVFQGPCKSSTIHFLVHGNIIAPGNISDWPEDERSIWILFSKVNGVTVDGGGVIDGVGANWWSACSSPQGCMKPTALAFSDCENLELSGLNHKNSPRNHISISSCVNVSISSLNITAPGIDIAGSTYVQITNLNIGTGDDCIAINGGSSYINISYVACGPGHGISIGSLGHDGENASVEEIHVKHSSFFATQNGARIKTWQGGKGYARKISYENITLMQAGNPIVIDQFYCPGQSCKNNNSSSSAVQISDVSFIGFSGTSVAEDAIKLSCDKNMGCTNIVVDDVDITSSSSKTRPHSSCVNAHGSSSDTIPPLKCLQP